MTSLKGDAEECGRDDGHEQQNESRRSGVARERALADERTPAAASRSQSARK